MVALFFLFSCSSFLIHLPSRYVKDEYPHVHLEYNNRQSSLISLEFGKLKVVPVAQNFVLIVRSHFEKGRNNDHPRTVVVDLIEHDSPPFVVKNETSLAFTLMVIKQKNQSHHNLCISGTMVEERRRSD